jgi:CHAT domain-containing protein
MRYGESLYFLAFLLRKTGDPDGAEPLLLEYVAFNERKYGKTHFEYARSLSDLALLYSNDKAEYQKAQAYQMEALGIMEKTVGKSNATYALTLNYLGSTYSNTSAYEKAEVLFLEALDTQKKIKARARQIVITLNNLAQVYLVTGAYNKAETYILESLDLYEQVIGIENPNYVNSLRSLAEIFLKKGELEKSEQFYLKTQDRVEKLFGKEHMNAAIVLSNLALVYIEMRNFAKSEQVLQESQNILERLSLQELPDYAFTQITMAGLYIEMGKYEQAEPLLLNAKSIIEKTAGKEFQNYSEAINALTTLYWKQRKMDLAQPALLEGIELQRNALLKGTQHLSERELDAYMNKYASNLNRSFSFAQFQPEVSSACFDNILFQKGFLLNTISQVSKLASNHPASKEKYLLLQSYRRRLAAQYTQTIAERDSGQIASLEEKANSLEKQLARDVAGFSEAVRQFKWQDIQAELKPGEVAIEFVDYQYYNPDPTDNVMYAALIILSAEDLSKAGKPNEPQFIPLFEKNELLPHLRGATGGNNFLKINALYTPRSTASGQESPYELIWKPLEEVLKNTSTIYCSPSGLLHYLNLAAIPTPEGKPYGDTRQIVLLGSTRSLVIPNHSGQNNGSDAYLSGGIRYDTDSSLLLLANQNIALRSTELSGAPVFHPDSSATRAGDLNYLPATANEVLEIGQMLRAANFSTKVDTGFYASEEAVRSLGIGKPSPRIIHLATHGYFFPDPKGKKSRDDAQEPVFKMSEHPMIRSGLIMAGAKQAWLTGKHPEGQEDGILTAYEISQMNLSNTELVVLSACETGLGQVSGNEGVYGLQRAFKIAGAKYLIMSLWKVDDQSTRAFMTEFYKQWLQGKQSIPQAFRAAQQSMRAKNSSPYDWAGFVLIE